MSCKFKKCPIPCTRKNRVFPYRLVCIENLLALLEHQTGLYIKEIKARTHRPKVLYICDKRACLKCNSNLCFHTDDITHAKNFACSSDGSFWENLAGEDFYSIKANGIQFSGPIQFEEVSNPTQI